MAHLRLSPSVQLIISLIQKQAYMFWKLDGTGGAERSLSIIDTKVISAVIVPRWSIL